MKKILSLLLLLFCIGTVSVHAYLEHTEYGGNSGNTHRITLNSRGFSFNSSVEFPHGQDHRLEPMIGDFVGFSNLQLLIWENQNLFLVNLTDIGSTSNGIQLQMLLGVDLEGQPSMYGNDYISLVDDGSNAYFYRIEFNATNYNVSYNFTAGTTGQLDGQGVRCYGDYCVFMDINNTIFRVDMNNNIFTKYPTIDDNENNYDLRTPSIGDIDKDGNYEAVFPIANNTGSSGQDGVYLFAYTINSNTSLSFFTSITQPDGYVYTTISDATQITSPIIHDFDGGNPEVSILIGTKSSGGNAQTRFGIFDSTGSVALLEALESNCGFGDNDLELPSQPTINQRLVNGAVLRGMHVWSQFNGGVAYSTRAWSSSDFSLDIERCLRSGNDNGMVQLIGTTSGRVFETWSIMVSVDMNRDDHDEILTPIKVSTQPSVVFYFLNSSNITDPVYVLDNISGSDNYGVSVFDYNNDNFLDVGAWSSSEFRLYSSNLTNIPPVITDIGWNTCNSVCYGNIITYSASYTDNEDDNVQMAIDCFGNGSITSWSSFSSSPTQSCNMTKIGTFEPIIYIRQLSNNDNDSFTRSTATCSSGVTVNLGTCHLSGQSDNLCQTSCSQSSFINFTGGIKNDGVSVIDGYTSKNFDSSQCSGWDGALKLIVWFCPVWVIIKFLLSQLFSTIFSTFSVFLILVLIIVVIVMFKKRGING